MKSGITLRSLAFALTRTSPCSAGPFPRPLQKPTVEVAFVLDTTGSMGGLIEGAKTENLVDRDRDRR